jgi:hypothetical protein
MSDLAFYKTPPSLILKKASKKQKGKHFLLKNALKCSREHSMCHRPHCRPFHVAVLGEDKKKPLKENKFLP